MSLGSSASRGGEEAPSRSGPESEDACQESVAKEHMPEASLRAFSCGCGGPEPEKFMKLTLGWTTPRVRHPEQADRWSWLILAAYTQLRLARTIVADRRLPWEKPLSQKRLTPTRVLRAFCGLLPDLGTPARAPKPRGRSPGRPKGSLSGPAKCYPAIKKAA